MTFCALVAGGNIAKTPLILNVDEVAELVTMETLPQIITAISNALPRPTEGEAKGTTPTTTANDGKG